MRCGQPPSHLDFDQSQSHLGGKERLVWDLMGKERYSSPKVSSDHEQKTNELDQ